MKNAILIILALCAFAGSAHADSMSSTLGQPLSEVSHSVTVSLKDGIATFVVQRTFANSGTIPDEAVLSLDMPYQAAATGLRIRSGHIWYKGELLPAGEAAQKYEELTGIGVSRLKDPALLAWVSANILELRVFPVPVNGTTTLEYTLTAPARWRKGRWILDYPRRMSQSSGLSMAEANSREPLVEPSLAPIVMTLEASKDYARIAVDNHPVTFAQPLVLIDAHESTAECEYVGSEEECEDYGFAAKIEAFPAKTETIVSRYGTTEAATREAVFERLQIEMPAKLSTTPESAHVVFVMDRSRSLTSSMINTQFQVMRAFAEHLPGGKFEVVLADRHSERLSDDFMAQPDFLEVLSLLENNHLEYRNGSHLDVGLETAREMLKSQKGVRYIVAFTDDLLRNALEPSSMEEASDILTHIVVLGSLWLRDDEHRLAPITHKAGGLLVHAVQTDELPRYVEHLVRPVMLEFVDIKGGMDVPEDLWEGDGYLHFSERVTTSSTFGVLRGKLWHKDVLIRPRSNAAYNRATAGWVFTSDRYFSINEDLQMKLAMYARAVSPVTSYLAIEPGVRPSTQGLPMMARGFGARGMGASGSGIGRAIVRGDGLETLLGRLKEACQNRHPEQSGQIIVHSTRDEVVDVVAYSSNAMTTCMVDGIWNFRLPDAFVEIRYATHPVHF